MNPTIKAAGLMLKPSNMCMKTRFNPIVRNKKVSSPNIVKPQCPAAKQNLKEMKIRKMWPIRKVHQYKAAQEQ